MSALYGLMAEFHDPKAVVEATEAARMAGYRQMDAYSPYPIEALSEALALPKSHVATICLGGGIAGLVAGYGLQYWSSVIEYPMNIGGRPFHSWVAFIPPAYETTILFAAFSAVLGMLALNGLPQPYHPVFNVPAFAGASRDKFFLCIEAGDPLFDAEKTRAFLASQPGVADVAEVQP
ncbi:MAG: DUF3341 domain-containing protein [Vicinamibacteria bacterium]|nr:DUF3341 domain-containing protein [Vicinamibacteria bacterium]